GGWSPETTASVFAIEVYTPKKVKTADDHIYYECGEWYPVLYPGTAQRALSRKDWTFTNNASITCTTYSPGGGAEGVKVFEKKPFNAGDCSRVPKRVHLDYESGVSILYLDMN